MANLPRLGDDIKLPQLCPGARVKGTGVAAWPFGDFRRQRADHQHIAKDGWRIGIGRAFELHLAIAVEFGGERAVGSVQRDDRIGLAVEQPRTALTISGPVCHAAADGRAGHLVAPQLAARMRLQRHHRIAQRQIHDAIDHHGHRPRQDRPAPFGAQAIGPGALKLPHIAGVDIVERHEALPTVITGIERPVAIRRADQRILLRHERRGEQATRQCHGHQFAHTPILPPTHSAIALWRFCAF